MESHCCPQYISVEVHEALRRVRPRPPRWPDHEKGGSPAAGFRSWLLLPSGEKVGMRGGSCAALSLGHGFWFWFGREIARLRRAFVRLPAPESLLFAGPKRRNQEKGPVEPADPTSLGARGVGNRQDTSCSTGGHTAPCPQLRQAGTAATCCLPLVPTWPSRSIPASWPIPPHRYSSERWNPVPWVGGPRPPLRLRG
jgi:hypothetical protein